MMRLLKFFCVMTVSLPFSAGAQTKTEDVHVRDPFIVADREAGVYRLYRARPWWNGQEVWMQESSDLREWTQQREVMRVKPEWNVKGVWAPEVHRYAGRWWLFVTLCREVADPPRRLAGEGAPDRRIQARGTWIFRSESPEGPFVPVKEESVTPPEWSCLDGTLWVEDGRPYMVFCHEWEQVRTGTVMCARLKDDLSGLAETPRDLFKAMDFSPDASFDPKQPIYDQVTDGPFVFRSDADGKLKMVWSNLRKSGYVEIVCESASGKIKGPWGKHRVLFDRDGGHGMIFRKFDGTRALVLHSPNDDGKERMKFVERVDGEPCCESGRQGVIRPGVKWFDTEGNPICAQGGSVIARDGLYYWCAVNREHTTGTNKVWHSGIVLYSSPDLATWTRMGVIIPPDESDESSILHPHRLLDRCNIVYNDRTRKFVCWVHLLDDCGQSVASFVAEKLIGPWNLAKRRIQPNGMECGDFNIAKDDDGRAYLYFNRPHSMLAIVELSDDYTDTKGVCATFAYTPGPPLTREAPSYFVRNGKHYIISSGTTHYYPNPSEVIVADDRAGPWKNLGEIATDDPSRTTFHSQICQVLKIPGKKDLYVVIADRWLPHRMSVNYPELEAAYNKYFGRAYDQKFVDLFEKKTGGDLFPGNAPIRDACQVWLPLRFASDGKPILEWRDSWRVDDYE